MSTHVTDGDWKYTRDLRNSDAAPGGLVIQDVYHQQYLLAKDIRVTRIWVGSLTPARPILKDYKLGSSALPVKTVKAPINLPSEQEGLIRPFKTPLHDPVSYETRDPVLGPNTESEKLVIQQDYLFPPDYGKSPPHEPGGFIDAVRIYPLVSFSYPASSTRQVDYIRVDYRLALTVEQFLKGTTNVARGTEFRDQIGVFRDGETLGRYPGLNDIYEAVEKPVRWEMLGEGLNWGKKSRWDNIHQWALGELPETPGASHAAHLHWRWGKPATEKTETPKKLAAGPQFAGPGGPGTPLLDPRIPEQRLRFAITAFTPSPGGGPKEWAADENGSTANFEELFMSARGPTPLPIYGGAGLVIWLSVEARRKPTRDPWQGTFFAHGMFFAHELFSILKSEGALALLFGDINREFQKGTVNEQKWWRPLRPDDK